MTKIQLDIDRQLDDAELKQTQEILIALISCGAIFGVRSGRAIIHFDPVGIFQGIELDYWPWKRREQKKVERPQTRVWRSGEEL